VYDPRKPCGRFESPGIEASAIGSARRQAGPTGAGGFKAARAVITLLSLALPVGPIARSIFPQAQALEDRPPSVSGRSYHMCPDGWTFDPKTGSTGDTVQIRSETIGGSCRGRPHYNRTLTVPVLGQKKRNRGTIVNTNRRKSPQLNVCLSTLDRREGRLTIGAAAPGDRPHTALVVSDIHNGVLLPDRLATPP